MLIYILFYFGLLFYFSSSRRHTMWPRDWSSDVCSVDLTGFGLLGHAWEMARGSQLHIEIDFDQLPWLPQAREFAAQGVVTGASNRNWAAYGEQVHLAEHLDLTQRHLLTDPQTSGGLLLSCAPEAVEQVMETLRTHGFAQAAPIGRVQTGAAAVQVA